MLASTGDAGFKFQTETLPIFASGSALALTVIIGMAGILIYQNFYLSEKVGGLSETPQAIEELSETISSLKDSLEKIEVNTRATADSLGVIPDGESLDENEKQ